MPSRLKNAPAVFSRIVIASFQKFIHKFVEVYMDDCTVYILLKYHVSLFQLMFYRFHEMHISLNLRKCIFCVPHGKLLGHIVCREGVLVDPAKVSVILNMPPPTSAKMLHSTLAHIVYYLRLIKRYETITTPLEKLLKKSELFRWTPESNKAFDILKQKLSSAPILIFPNWEIEFHVHVDASGIVLGAILAQLGEGNMDHPIYFASRKPSQAEEKYTTTKREGLAMIYEFQNFIHYLLGSHFKFFTDHYALKYPVNKPVLEGRIYRWLLFFQEFLFEVIVKLGRCNVGPNHLYRLESGESGRAVDNHLPDVDLFHIEAIPEYLEEIDFFLSTRTYPKTYLAIQKRHMVVRAVDYQLIVEKLYKLGLDIILRRCVLNHERQDILWECHIGFVIEHVGGKATTHNILHVGLWWDTLFKYAKEYARSCDTFQRIGNSYRRDELPLHPFRALQAFEKWVVDFIGSINPLDKHSKPKYIITTTNYITRWDEAEEVQDFSTDTAARFIFDNVITPFGCPRSLTSEQGTHFINSTIATLMTEFFIQHYNRIPYHPQANGTIEAFNTILERGLTKVCCTKWEY
jgi:hypothetical protein